VIRGAIAAASDPTAEGAAAAVLAAGHSAVDAILAGFFAAAGVHPGVLLSPCVALVAGTGVGARAFDGRSAQPGLGAPRPRGFVDEASIPMAARVPAPRGVPMLVLLHSYRGRASLSQIARAGVLAAEKEGAKARAALIRRVGAAGVLALRSDEVVRALVAAAGPIAGGILTEQDLREALPVEQESTTIEMDEGMQVVVPPFEAPTGMSDAQVLVACDGRGVLAALSYVPPQKGVEVPELELELSQDAVPVRRGVTRVSPGTPLPAAAPIAIATRGGSFGAAIGLPGRPLIDLSALEELAKGAAAETVLADLRTRGGGQMAVAVVTDGRTARNIVTAGRE